MNYIAGPREREVQRNAEIWQRYLAGEPTNRIAQAFGVSRARVRYLVARQKRFHANVAREHQK